MVVLLYHRLELLAGVEGHDPTGGDGNFLSGLGVPPGTLGLVAQLKIAKS
jgi:hypothetical protein